MLIPVPTEHPFAGIFVRLQRAEENIVNLEHEIHRFFQECKYPVMPDSNDKRWDDALNYHTTLPIPKRFSVLAGEIVHHLRSSLDHVVWVFSDDAYRRKHETSIQFPVLVKRPGADALKRFEGQIGGISKTGKVREFIGKFQPYHLGIDAPNSPIAIVHKMDIDM